MENPNPITAEIVRPAPYKDLKSVILKDNKGGLLATFYLFDDAAHELVSRINTPSRPVEQGVNKRLLDAFKKWHLAVGNVRPINRSLSEAFFEAGDAIMQAESALKKPACAGK